jgi:hypothetical protein
MKLKFANALSLALIVAMLFTSVALADNVINNVVVGGNDTITAGGSTVISYQIQNTNSNNSPDPQNSCNPADGSLATVTINTPSGVTVDTSGAPGSQVTLTFNSCGTNQPATFTSSTPGSYIITVSVNDLGTGTYSTSQATFTLHVNAPANTAPSLSLPSNISAEATSAAGAVVTYTATATDAQDDPDPTPLCSPASGSTFPLGTTTVSCSVTDSGGLSANGSFTVTVQDTTAPALTLPSNIVAEATSAAGAAVIYSASANDGVDGAVAINCSPASGSTFALGTTAVTCSATDAAGNIANGGFDVLVQDTIAPTINGAADRTPDSNGWYNADVTVTFTCSDSGSGIASCSGPTTLSSDGADQFVIGTATDNVGNTASATVSNIDIDQTAPTASASASPAANGFGWNNSSVTVSYNGTDALSGIDFCDAADVLSSEGAGQLASGTCTDEAGNVSSPATATVNIDLTNPLVSLVGGPAHGGTYFFGFVPAAPTCSASDALSGLNGSCSVSGYSNAVGTHTVSASVTDKAGNSASASATYTVSAWTLNGFYQPVDMNSVTNTVRGGSTVPLKFEVFAGPTELTATSVVASFVQTRIACDTSATIDEIEVTTTGGTSLRYDATGGQFIQNWQTPRQAGACYRVTMTTQDGSFLVAFFKLK